MVEDDRFAFGENWSRFLSLVDDDRIAIAESSLQRALGADRLDEVRFLDAGCGSGLFSLAAHRLGASVHSFDYDPMSVKTTQALQARFAPEAGASWTIEQGSVLDREYLERLGRFDVVYSWGVLHHTGSMWEAIESVSASVDDGGTLFIAIYNDQGWKSRFWLRVKRAYNHHGRLTRRFLEVIVGSYFGARKAFSEARRGKLPTPRRMARNKRDTERGMSLWYDVRDWVGGYPYEVATPEAIVNVVEGLGFEGNVITHDLGHGCNEFVFTRIARPTSA